MSRTIGLPVVDDQLGHHTYILYWLVDMLVKSLRILLSFPQLPTHYVLEHDGYTMIATNVSMFHKMCEMPLTFDPARLDEGGGTESRLRRNVAKYHTSCRRMFNNTKLEHARKRHSDVQSE